MYQYCHHINTEIITQDTNVGLHDCKATQLSLKDGLFVSRRILGKKKGE